MIVRYPRQHYFYQLLFIKAISSTNDELLIIGLICYELLKRKKNRPIGGHILFHSSITSQLRIVCRLFSSDLSLVSFLSRVDILSRNFSLKIWRGRDSLKRFFFSREKPSQVKNWLWLPPRLSLAWQLNEMQIFLTVDHSCDRNWQLFLLHSCWWCHQVIIAHLWNDNW